MSRSLTCLHMLVIQSLVPACLLLYWILTTRAGFDVWSNYRLNKRRVTSCRDHPLRISWVLNIGVCLWKNFKEADLSRSSSSHVFINHLLVYEPNFVSLFRFSFLQRATVYSADTNSIIKCMHSFSLWEIELLPTSIYIVQILWIWALSLQEKFWQGSSFSSSVNVLFNCSHYYEIIKWMAS